VKLYLFRQDLQDYHEKDLIINGVDLHPPLFYSRKPGPLGQVRDNRLCHKSETGGGLARLAGCPVLPVCLFPSFSLKRKTVISKQVENHA
jgi:hypothetical protein